MEPQASDRTPSESPSTPSEGSMLVCLQQDELGDIESELFLSKTGEPAVDGDDSSPDPAADVGHGGEM